MSDSSAPLTSRVVTCMGCHASCLASVVSRHQHKRSGCCGKGVFPLVERPAGQAKVVGGGWINYRSSLASKRPQVDPQPDYGAEYFEGDKDEMSWDQEDAKDQEASWPSSLLLASGPPYVWSGSVPSYRTLQPHLEQDLPSCLTKTPRPAYEAQEFNRLAHEAQKDLAARRSLLTMPPRQGSPGCDTPPLSPDLDFFKEHDQQVQAAATKMDANPSMLSIVDFIQESNISEKDADRLLKILASADFEAKDVGFSSWRTLKRAYDDIIPTLLKVRSEVVVIPDKDGQPVELRHKDGTRIMFYYHNIWERALLMYREPRFAQHLILQPQPQYRTLHCGRRVRVYNTFSSGLLFQEMVRMVPPKHVVVSPIIYSDEATRFTKCSAYPIYCK